MTEEEIQNLVLTVVERINQTREPDQQLTVAADAKIFGEGSPLDSLGLVALTMDLEEELLDSGVNVMLSDERAMSQRRSPFQDVPSLVAYIQSSLSDSLDE